MGKRNFKVDFVELFANIVNGEFFERVHHFPYGPGGSGYFCPDYPFIRLRRIQSLPEVFP